MNKKVFCLIICFALCVVLIGCENNKKYESDDNHSGVIDTPITLENNENEENKVESISLDSQYGKAVEDCFHNIRINDEVYPGCIAEFDSVKDAPKSYLAACAASRGKQNANFTDIYEAKVPFSDFEKALIELFGNEAEGLITPEDLDTVFYVQKNEDDETYHFNGWGPSDISYSPCFIKSIIKQEDLLKVEVVEYRVTLSESPIDMEKKNVYYGTISDMNSKNTTRLDYKFDPQSDRFSYFDESGNVIDSLDDYIAENLLDKVSIRTIEFKYNQDNGTAIMLRNSLNR